MPVHVVVEQRLYGTRCVVVVVRRFFFFSFLCHLITHSSSSGAVVCFDYGRHTSSRCPTRKTQKTHYTRAHLSPPAVNIPRACSRLKPNARTPGSVRSSRFIVNIYAPGRRRRRRPLRLEKRVRADSVYTHPSVRRPHTTSARVPPPVRLR